MGWARVDDGAYTHPKFLGLDPAAVGLWALALSYCNHHLTDGFVPRTQVPRLVACPPTLAFKLAHELQKHGLWEERGKDGFQVHDYLDWNPSATEIRRDRALHRERQARYRSRQTGRFGDASRSASAEASGDPSVTAAVTSTHATPLHYPPIVPPPSGVATPPHRGDDDSRVPAWLPPPGIDLPRRLPQARV